MSEGQNRWLDQMMAENVAFRERVDVQKLPIARAPGHAVITCMDPRVNLEAIGISGFTSDGGGDSAVRVIRTIGAMAGDRSLIVGIFLAGIREITLLMHTDCGCCLAYSKIDTIVENMQKNLPAERFRAFKSQIGEPFSEKLRSYLKAFDDPEAAVKQEIANIRTLPFVPDDLILHGMVYELQTGQVKVVVAGY